MKKYSLLFGICFLVNVVNAQQLPLPSLYGTWQVDINKTLNNMSRSEKLKFDSLPSIIQNNMKVFYSNRKFEFLDSGEVVISFSIQGNQKNISGSWTLDRNSRLIITAKGIKKEFCVEWKSNHLIRLVYTEKSPQILISSLSLNAVEQ